MRNVGLEEAQAGIKIAGGNIKTLDMQMTPLLRQKVKKNYRASWWKWKRRVKSWLKAQHSGTKIMASGPITSWQIDGETVTDFTLLGSKISADGVCSHEIKRHLLLGRKVMTNLDSILKSRDITLPTKVHPVKAMAFPLWLFSWAITSCDMWESYHKESWVPKNWCFWTVV